MAQLEGLKMQGIRSIGEESHTINFLHPLTIIQGPNGTGKTTTIEALNYITTGALPPGKMQAFIHNNRLANKSRVDALVQLIFRDIKGNKCTATKRCNSSTNKGGKLTTKSDEFTLQVHDKFGNVKCLSSKVSDFNREIGNLLGVPKAVLEYVLFCHQEDSNWALSEPKELKVRFDAIFEVTKYVKALDQIRKSMKELNVQLQLIDKELPHMEMNCKRRAELRLSYDESIQILKKNKEIIEDSRQKKDLAEKDLCEARQKLDLVFKRNHDSEVLQGQIRIHQKFLECCSVPDYCGSREELEHAIKMIKESSELRSAERQGKNTALEIQAVAKKMSHCSDAEESCKTKLMQVQTKQMLQKSREDEYRNFLTEISKEYCITESDVVNSLRQKIAEINDDLELLKQSQQDHKEQLEDELGQLRIKVAELKSVNSLKAPEASKLSASILSLKREIQKSGNATQTLSYIQQEISKYESQLSKLGDFKLLDTLWQSIQTIQTEINIMRMDFIEIDGSACIDTIRNKFTEQLERTNDQLSSTLDGINQLKERVRITNQLNEFKERKATTGEKSIHQDVMKKSLTEKEEQYKEIQQTLTEASKVLPDTEKKLKKLEAEYTELVNTITEEKRKSLMQIDKINQGISRIVQLENSTKENLQSDDVEKLNKTLTQLKAESELLQRKKIELEKQFSGAESKRHELRHMEDQIRKMDTLAEYEKLKTKLNDIISQSKTEGLGDYSELKKLESQLNSKVLQLNNLIEQKNGEQMQLKKKVEELKRQLDDPRFVECKKSYTSKLLERAATASTIDDLDKYYKVVDDSIIAFHQQKMEQINQILLQLWSRVYQGNDIETIKIKSQPVGSGEKKKSYDYSVVMVVDNTDIEMRDRCSAGQKVLASILIRIALADVFATNCPVIALDEPTTNLDRDKIENVANVLSSLIELRNAGVKGGGALGATFLYNDDDDEEIRSASQFYDATLQDGDTTLGHPMVTSTPIDQTTLTQRIQRPLQLIIITHDSKLVEFLNRDSRPEYIYELSKDLNGVSHCKKRTHLSLDSDRFDESEFR